MKTAVIVAGVCRYSDIPSKTWDIFPFDADLYISTWDITNNTYSNKLINSSDEIELIKRNTRQNKRTKLISVNVSDYEDAIASGKITWSLARPFFLLNELYEKIKSSEYTRIIYFRPDLYLTTNNGVTLTEHDFTVDDSSVKILGLYEPYAWVEHHLSRMEDHFFCMTTNMFEKFLQIFKVIDASEPDIHRIFYNFFKINDIKIETIDNMRCALIRKEIEDYYKETGEDLSLETMMRIYLDVYLENQETVNKIKRDSINLGYLEIDKRTAPSKEVVNLSAELGGILKLRDR
jgi:hypothetical protein